MQLLRIKGEILQYYLYSFSVLCTTTVLPELIGDKDHSPLKQKGGKHLQEFPDAETLQETVKIHMLQSGVHRATQSQDLAKQKEHMDFSFTLNAWKPLGWAETGFLDTSEEWVVKDGVTVKT